MTRYCFFNSVEAWGGGEKWHLEVAHHLHKKGERVLLIVMPGSELDKKARALGLHVLCFRLSNLSFLNPIVLFRIASIFRKHKINSLVMNSPRDLKCAGFAAKIASVEQIVFRRGSDIPVKDTALNRFLYQSIVSKVLVNSLATKRSLNKHNKNLVANNKIFLVPNGIDALQFLEGSIDTVYSKQENEIVLCTLGRLVDQKNQSFLIDLAAEIKQRGLKIKVIIGGEGPLKSSLELKAKGLGVHDDVLFPGFIERPKDLYHSGDIFVLPSLWEGFGYVIAEAGLCALPTVAFDISSNSQIIQDGKTGLLISKGNLSCFADAVVKLAEDKLLRAEMGRAAKSFVQQNFEAKNIFKEVEAVISC